jgi:hypothetical protein
MLAFLPAACRRKKAETEDANRPAMMLAMNDPRTSIQLIRGFYAVESGTWRWTERSFAASLRVPADAAQNGARLLMKVTVPQTQIDKLGSMTLSASVNGVGLPPETYAHAGGFLYERDVPATAFRQDIALVEFALDKVAPAPPPDKRLLGIVVTSVGFMRK